MIPLEWPERYMRFEWGRQPGQHIRAGRKKKQGTEEDAV